MRAEVELGKVMRGCCAATAESRRAIARLDSQPAIPTMPESMPPDPALQDKFDREQPAVTLWYQSLQDGDEQAAEKLFEHCFPRLLRYARAKLPENLKRALDEEDVALSAFKSFCKGAQAGALGEIQGRDELWRLLACITARKGMAYIRHETRQKRGGGKLRGESIFRSPGQPSGDNSGQPGIQNVADARCSPAALAELEDECRHLLDILQDETLQTIALLRMEGYSVEEIAARIGSAKRSVERRLNLIRRIWTESEASSATQQD
jgi:DNA-directed RNA polymerase specialized sigma24 family protein